MDQETTALGVPPLPAADVVETLKTYLDEGYRIRVSDLVQAEVERVHSLTLGPDFPVSGPFTIEEIAKRMEQYETLTGVLQSLVAMGCYWGNPEHDRVWSRALGRIAAYPFHEGGYDQRWYNLRWYPALLLLYAGGIASVAADRYGCLSALLKTPIWHLLRAQSAGRFLYTFSVLPPDVASQLPDVKGHRVALSQRLFRVLREPFLDLLPSDEEFQSAFDRFEYLLALVHADLYEKENRDRWWGPIGLFAYRSDRGMASEIVAEAEQSGQQWPPLAAGLFDGSPERFRAVQQGFAGFVSQVGYAW